LEEAVFGGLLCSGILGLINVRDGIMHSCIHCKCKCNSGLVFLMYIKLERDANEWVTGLNNLKYWQFVSCVHGVEKLAGWYRHTLPPKYVLF
jgi:hypothetical protein